ncbi:MAG TPA: serine hydrolase [Bryobacterales bacterium]|nr:serine hydrolase [Bryobacterales bacterium]
MILLRTTAALCATLAAGGVYGYPLDGAARTGIRRLVGYRLENEGKIKGGMKLPPGALLRSDQIVLHLKGASDSFDITAQTPHDPYLQAGLERIFGARDPSYGVALLDISDPRRPRYASLRAETKMIPGSVGKLLIATGLFGALAELYPSSIEAREKLLRDTTVTADGFIFRDGKTVPIYHDGDAVVAHRRLELGDKFSLWEWADHMLSQSSNAAGSMVWKQVMLLRQFGARYPVPKEEETAFFHNTPKPELRKLALESLEGPARAAGIDTTRFRLGTFFTRNAEVVIPGAASYACPNELLRWLVKMEEGKLADAWSSLEIKKLLYFVRPRYRYASSPALDHAAVYFKSGSLFECRPEPGFTCKQYMGNVRNLMHSVAVVESGQKVYLVAIMSNVLRVNSAKEHQAIAGEIEKWIQARPKTAETSD